MRHSYMTDVGDLSKNTMQSMCTMMLSWLSMELKIYYYFTVHCS